MFLSNDLDTFFRSEFLQTKVAKRFFLYANLPLTRIAKLEAKSKIKRQTSASIVVILTKMLAKHLCQDHNVMARGNRAHHERRQSPKRVRWRQSIISSSASSFRAPLSRRPSSSAYQATIHPTNVPENMRIADGLPTAL